MRILVTGGCGFIGSNFIRRELSLHPDSEITNLDCLTYAGNLSNTLDFSKDMRYSFIRADINEINGMKIAKDFDFVVNFAAETHVDNSISGPDSFVRTNVNGTHELLKFCLKSEIGLLQVSTDEVYGSIEKGSFKESDNFLPNSPYSASKASAEMLVRAYNKTYGLKTLVSRSSNNYGPFQHPEKLIPLFVTNLIQGRKVPLYGTGLNVRDWIFVNDNSEMISMLLHSGKSGEAYNIGGKNELSNIEITLLLLKALGKPESFIEHVGDRKGHDFRYALDCSKFENDFGKFKRTDFKEGLGLTIKWYSENASWWNSLKQRKG